uniref:Uncharacterized protein n=1 Tax=Rhizophora mucronata TaxID=61149 RepID=A0A2P2N234_RHIMU
MPFAPIIIFKIK